VARRNALMALERDAFNKAYINIYRPHYGELRVRRSAEGMKKLRLPQRRGNRRVSSAHSAASAHTELKSKRRGSAHFSDHRYPQTATGPLSQELQWEEELLFTSAARAHTLLETYEALRACCLLHSDRDGLDMNSFLRLPFRLFAGPDSFLQERLRIAVLPAGARAKERVNLLSQFRCRVDRDTYVTLNNKDALHTMGSVPLCFRCTYRMYGVEGKTFDRDRSIAFRSGQRGAMEQHSERSQPQREACLAAFMAVTAHEGETQFLALRRRRLCSKR